MSNGLQIAKNKFNVRDTAPENFYVNTQTPLFKLSKSGAGKLLVDSTSNKIYDIVIEHDLGYIPLVIVTMDRNPGTNRRIATTYDADSLTRNNDINVFVYTVTKKDFTINVHASFAPTVGAYGYNYYVYYDSVKAGGI